MAAVAGALTRPTRAGIGSLWCWERRRHGGERTGVTDRLDARSAQTPSDPRVPRRLRTRGRAPERLPGAPRRVVLRALPARRMGTACLRPPSARARHCVSHSREVAAGRDTFLRAVRPAQPTADLVRVGSAVQQLVHECGGEIVALTVIVDQLPSVRHAALPRLHALVRAEDLCGDPSYPSSGGLTM
jgi:hypothetical protein